MLKFTIEGKPVPAVRMTQRSMYANKYAMRYLTYKNHVALIARHTAKDKVIEGDVGVKLTHYIHGNRADIDNLYKGVTDALNKIVYKDDRQIKEMKSRIIPCDKDEQRTDVEIYELEVKGVVEMDQDFLIEVQQAYLREVSDGKSAVYAPNLDMIETILKCAEKVSEGK